MGSRISRSARIQMARNHAGLAPVATLASMSLSDFGPVAEGDDSIASATNKAKVDISSAEVVQADQGQGLEDTPAVLYTARFDGDTLTGVDTTCVALHFNATADGGYDDLGPASYGFVLNRPAGVGTTQEILLEQQDNSLT